MCSDNPDLPKEANKAKCIAAACCVVCAPAATKPPPPRAAPHTAATQQPHKGTRGGGRARGRASGRAQGPCTLQALATHRSVLLPPACAGRSCFSLINFLIPLCTGVCSLGSWGYSHASARVSWSAAAPPSTRMLGLANSRRCVRSGLAPNPHRPKQTHRTPAAPLPTPYLTPITLTLTLTYSPNKAKFT